MKNIKIYTSIIMLIVFPQLKSYTQSEVTDFGFAHYVGNFCGENAQMNILYNKKNIKTNISLANMAVFSNSTLRASIIKIRKKNLTNLLYLYLPKVCIQPLGYGINSSSITDIKGDSILSGLIFRDNLFCNISGSFDRRRISHIPDTTYSGVSNDNGIDGVFKDNFYRFIGKRSEDSNNLKPIVLYLDTLNEKKYLKEILFTDSLLRTKYANKNGHIQSITFINDNLLSGVYQFGNAKSESLYSSYSKPINFLAFTFLRKKKILLNTQGIFSKKFNNQRKGKFNIPPKDGRIGILYEYPPDAYMNNFFVTDKGIIFVWVSQEGKHHSNEYLYYEMQYAMPFEYITETELQKIFFPINSSSMQGR